MSRPRPDLFAAKAAVAQAVRWDALARQHSEARHAKGRSTGSHAHSSIVARPDIGRLPADQDRAGYEALAHAHYARLRRLCVILLGDAAEAEEVIQEVFMKAWQVSAAGAPADWAAWLTRVAVNACHDRGRAGWWRHFRRFSEWIERVPLRADVPSPVDMAISTQTQERLGRAFRALPPRQREVFVLRFVEDMPTAQVAATLGLGEGSVKRHLFRAIRRLRGSLGDLR